MTRLLISNVGLMVSGDIHAPTIEADSLLVENGLIAALGTNIQPQADLHIDAKGTTLTPGLIDSHCHLVFGDYTPRQNQDGFLDSGLHGGVTSVVSAGEAHLPGRPHDAVGAKALAILAAKSWQHLRPSGVKVLGGGLILEEGLEEQDFAEMAKLGVVHLGEIGLGSANRPDITARMVEWARRYGMTTMMHVGGTSIPGSATVTAADVIATNPHICAHVNGGPTAVSREELEQLIRDTPYMLEIVHCGNPRMAVETARLARVYQALPRLIIGNDHPSGTGVIPLGILRVMNLICSLAEVSGAEAVAMATGNTARVYGFNRGIIETGREADLILMDAPLGSVASSALQALEFGDTPAVSCVVIDGEIRVRKSRNTPPPKRAPIYE